MNRIPLSALTEATLGELYDRLDDAEAAAAVARHAMPTLRKAVKELPAMCRYHGDRLDPDRFAWGREACCDTGTPARRRREAETALDVIDQAAAPRRRTGPSAATAAARSQTPDTVRTAGHATGGHVRELSGGRESISANQPATSADTIRTTSGQACPDSPRFPFRVRPAAIRLTALGTSDKPTTAVTGMPLTSADTVRRASGQPYPDATSPAARRAEIRGAIDTAFDIPSPRPHRAEPAADQGLPRNGAPGRRTRVRQRTTRPGALIRGRKTGRPAGQRHHEEGPAPRGAGPSTAA